MRKLIFILLIAVSFSPIEGGRGMTLSQTPTQQWASRYVRPPGSSGLKNYMALDKVGNCYVAGDILGASNDAVVIKYNSAGAEQWARTYQGAGNRIDLPQGVVADSIGNSYVTITSGDNFGPNDIVTIKYDPLGIQQWLKIYDSGSNDEAEDIIMDNFGNVYVAGFSGNESLIIKYNPAGDTLWMRKYTQPNYRFPVLSIALDFQGNVLIGGNRIHTTNGGQEYFAIKYNSAGAFQWVQTTSFSALTGFAKIKADLNGNVIVTGMSLGGKIVTRKYNSSGAFQWQTLYDGPGTGGDMPYDMAVDYQSNILITGRSNGIGSGNYDYITIKYSPLGDSLWVKRYNGTSNANDESYSIDLDDSNNVYVTGRSINTGVSWDYVTIKYYTNGNQAWLATYNNLTANSDDLAYVVKVDRDNVFVTGISDRGGFVIDYVTLKYNQFLGIISMNESPMLYYLAQNFPNPFNPATHITFQLADRGFVELKVYDITGREVGNLIQDNIEQGSYDIVWDGSELPSGVYFYSLNISSGDKTLFKDTKRMILVK